MFSQSESVREKKNNAQFYSEKIQYTRLLQNIVYRKRKREKERGDTGIDIEKEKGRDRDS